MTIENDFIDKEETELKKYRQYYSVLIRWIRLLQNGGKLCDYFKLNKYNTIAIYGMSELGELLLDQLEAEGIQVEYVLDINKDKIYAPSVLSPRDNLPNVDVIIVCTIYCHSEIEQLLSAKVECPIVSFDRVLFETEILYGLPGV